MSNLEKQTQEELVIRKAKYRVKNAEGKYELVYLETSADQVEETADRVFVTPAEKTQITTNKEAIDTINGKIDVINGLETQAGSIAKALKDAKDYTDSEITKINGVNSALEGRVAANEAAVATVDSRIETAKSEVQGNVNTLSEKVSTNTNDIANLKDAVANKNNNTIVVDTEAEISTANAEPKVGDLAFVITSKRAYIYKGVEEQTVKAVPAGWVVFDEITNELDLVDYLKKSEAETLYRKLANKIAENDLTTELAQKINDKVDATHVSGAVEAAKTELNKSISANDTAIKQEVTNRTSEITRVEGLTTAISQRLDKFVPSVSAVEPVGAETGHVWLEIQA